MPDQRLGWVHLALVLAEVEMDAKPGRVISAVLRPEVEVDLAQRHALSCAIVAEQHNATASLERLGDRGHAILRAVVHSIHEIECYIVVLDLEPIRLRVPRTTERMVRSCV